MIEVKSLENISHFDGISASKFKCRRCGFNTHDELASEDDFCTPCERVFLLSGILQAISRFILPSLIMSVLILFVDIFKVYTFLLPILIPLVFFPSILTSMYTVPYIYYQVPNTQRIAHYLVNGKLIPHNMMNYLEKSSDLLKSYGSELNEIQKIVIKRNLVNNYLLNERPNLPNLISQWAKKLREGEEEFIASLFEETDIIEGFDFAKGVGVLPDIWNFIKNKDIENSILDKIELACEDLENATSIQKSYFLEDLYLVKDDLLEFINENNKWEIVKKTINEFEPEEPPKTQFESFLAQAQESARTRE